MYHDLGNCHLGVSYFSTRGASLQGRGLAPLWVLGGAGTG